MLKMHPVIAAEIMSQSESLVPIVPIVYHHHEHFDGTGYVSGIAGTNIPLGARILAVCDAYVAMTSTRPYRPTLSSSAALEELQRWSGSQFDPDIVTALVHVVQQRIEATSLEC
jgi:HD-GYP domain-containing protein (c-di-GMP phosphodiesterase class II)